MNVRDLLKPQRTALVVLGVELFVKKLNWKELNAFQKFADELEKADETQSAVQLCKYIIGKYISDKDGESVLDEGEVEELPVEFCIELLNKFLASVKGELPKEEDIKKN